MCLGACGWMFTNTAMTGFEASSGGLGCRDLLIRVCCLFLKVCNQTLRACMHNITLTSDMVMCQMR